jgi:hypothetical protein
MQKWEYMIIKVVNGIAFFENGEKVGENMTIEDFGKQKSPLKITLSKSGTLTGFLNEFGEDGWEAISINDFTDSSDFNILFKRPKSK